MEILFKEYSNMYSYWVNVDINFQTFNVTLVDLVLDIIILCISKLVCQIQWRDGS